MARHIAGDWRFPVPHPNPGHTSFTVRLHSPNSGSDAKSGDALELHRWLGTVSAAIAHGAAVVTMRMKADPGMTRSGLILAAAVVGIAAHFGGVLVVGPQLLQSLTATFSFGCPVRSAPNVSRTNSATEAAASSMPRSGDPKMPATGPCATT
jgi:hypothetical protein